MRINELCLKHGISEAKYCKCKSKYGGMEASDLKRVKELEAGNTKLKRMYALLQRLSATLLKRNSLQHELDENKMSDLDPELLRQLNLFDS